MKEALGADIAKFDGTVYRGEQPCFTPLLDAQAFRFEGAPVDVDTLLDTAPKIDERPGVSERAEAAATADPVMRHLSDNGMVKRELDDGRYAVVCPCADSHSGESNETSTVYMLPNFAGVKYGKFHCLHDHCHDRAQSEFIVALGLDPKRIWRAQATDGAPEVSEAQPDAASAPEADLDGEALLSDVRTFLLRFIAFPSLWCVDAVTLWAAHAHMVEHFHTTPRLAALSPEPESGKTRLLEILDVLTPNSMLILSPSVAAIFRKLAQQQVTLLFDEVDTIFTRRGKDDQNEDLRALLNAHYRRGASIPRCVGPRHEVQDFAVFAAVALAGIGDLPDTITTRSIVIACAAVLPANLLNRTGCGPTSARATCCAIGWPYGQRLSAKLPGPPGRTFRKG